MHIISSSAHLSGGRVVPAWANALRHFQRLLIECGSPLEVEHSQRLGLLFSKDVGSERDVERWASLFDADDVPATSMMLKALVVHNKWETALKLLRLGSDHPNSTELGELLAQDLLKKHLPDVAISVVQLLASTNVSHVKETDAVVTATPAHLSSSTDLLSESALHDSVGLATDPTYVPRDQRCEMSGLGAAVNKRYPRRGQWKEALDLLAAIYPSARGATKTKILEHMVVRCTYGGQHFALARQLATENPTNASSASIQRSLLFGALETGRLEDAVDALAQLSKLGSDQIPRHSFTRFCNSILESRRERDRSFNKRCASVLAENLWLCQRPDIRAQLIDFVMEFTERLPRLTEPESNLLPASEMMPRRTVAQIDSLASHLARGGQWKEALRLIQELNETPAHTAEEEIVLKAVVGSLNDWEKALQFFS